MALIEHNYFNSENLGPIDKTFNCHICTSIFKHRGSLYNHLRAVHKLKNIGKKTIRCLEKNCNGCFRQLLHLEKHLNKEHFRKIEKEQLLFGSLEEFKEWKEAVEKDTESEYVTCSPRHSTTTPVVMHFKCSRSGFYKEKLAFGTRKRRLKSQGSKKSGAHCTSRMIVHIDNNSKSVSVNFCKTHYGHPMALAQQKGDMVQVLGEINRPLLTPLAGYDISVLRKEVTADSNVDVDSKRQKVLSLLQSLMAKVNTEVSVEKLNKVEKILKKCQKLIWK